MNGQPLPAILPYFKDTKTNAVDDPWQEAYKRCLLYQVQAKSRLDHIRARVLGYLIREAPHDESRDMVCADICDCTGEDVLQRLADVYIGYFVRLLIPFAREHLPSSSQCSSCPSHEDVLDEDCSDTLCRSSHEEYIFKRDGYGCMVTGAYSIEQYKKVPDVDVEQLALLKIASILPRFDTRDCEAQQNNATGASTVMRRFGGINPDELTGDLVHRPENVMTLWETIFSMFHKLQVWFEPSDEDPNTCLVRTLSPTLCLPESFTLATTDTRLPKPSLDYLRLHAACARVAHVSGTSQYVASMYTKLEDQGMLANDGSSAIMLHVMLSALVH